jgi:glutathione synthase/RimK-type ligase-like ATP-grasp enzyme
VPTVLLLTAESLPHEDLDTALLAESLTQRGVRATVLVWSRTDDWPIDAELAVVRTTWDYTFRRDEFLEVLEASPVRVANPTAVLRWNSHKGYLVELADAGVPVVPGVLLRRGDTAELPELDAAQIIVKPTVAAGSRGVGLFDAGAREAAGHLADLLSRGDALVQAFEPSVRDGERSLIYLGGRYSHAVRKVPAAGDFRVQTRYGASNLPHHATLAEQAVAQVALDTVSSTMAATLLYARVDLVGSAGAPLVMELELIEPELFLPMAPGSADRLADAIIASL